VDKSVKAVKLDGVEPTQENAKSGKYPVVRQLCMNTKGEPQPLVKAFIEFILSPAGQVTWLHPKIGTEVSMALGYTVNLKNYATRYTTGNELHLEFFAGQHFTKWLALGLSGYFYQQVTGDSGAGARLGAFQGQALALGPCITLNGTIGKHPIGANLRYYDELTVTNRLSGHSFFGTLTFGF